ncbi:hypothetical protein GCM10010528_11000 [Gordonia defluvii]|jgi:hypothetical protein|uniref:PPE domain-containing protein n=1 Tax=Gordonia defluvii TaxID=283718 RepID=A0ABP6L3D2_9ACTN|nr:PPE domain-containing protein [Gordonia sp. UBA5067]
MTTRVGFTGVDWATRRPDQLRTDLMAGPGAAPLWHCAQSWADLAGDLDALVTATRRSIQDLQAEWDSTGAAAARRAVAGVPGWLDALAHRARQQSELVRGAAGAAETARLAMPAASAIDDARARLSTVAAAMTGGIAAAQRAGAELAVTTARVMADYERDCTPVVTAPPRSDRVPVLVRDTSGSSAARVESSKCGSSSAGAIPAGLAAMPPRVLGTFRTVGLGNRGTRWSAAARTTDVDRPAQPGVAPRRDAPPGPVGPIAGAPTVAAGRTAPTAASISAGAVEASPPSTAAAEPLTWVQLATGDQVRVADPTATNSAHTPV